MKSVFLPLSIFLAVAHQCQANTNNHFPCMRSKWNNGHSVFLRRHLPSGAPTSSDYNAWEKYLRSQGGCSRPTQSFIQPSEEKKVDAVCSSSGGKAYKENMCISAQPFSFTTVRLEPGTCGIKSISNERKHLILACDVLDNQCLPVHFEGNPYDIKPQNNAKACQNPAGKGSSLRMTWLWLTSFLLAIFLNQ